MKLGCIHVAFDCVILCHVHWWADELLGTNTTTTKRRSRQEWVRRGEGRRRRCHDVSITERISMVMMVVMIVIVLFMFMIMMLVLFDSQYIYCCRVVIYLLDY